MRDIPLTDALRQLAAGGMVDDELLSRVVWEDFGVADRIATKAWLELQQWVSDKDVRVRDKEYEQNKRSRLACLLKEIEAFSKE